MREGLVLVDVPRGTVHAGTADAHADTHDERSLGARIAAKVEDAIVGDLDRAQASATSPCTVSTSGPDPRIRVRRLPSGAGHDAIDQGRRERLEGIRNLLPGAARSPRPRRTEHFRRERELSGSGLRGVHRHHLSGQLASLDG